MLLCRGDDFFPRAFVDCGVDAIQVEFKTVLANQAHDLPPGLSDRKSIFVA